MIQVLRKRTTGVILEARRLKSIVYNEREYTKYRQPCVNR